MSGNRKVIKGCARCASSVEPEETECYRCYLPADYEALPCFGVTLTYRSGDRIHLITNECLSSNFPLDELWVIGSKPRNGSDLALLELAKAFEKNGKKVNWIEPEIYGIKQS